MTTGQRLKERRKEIGISTQEIAATLKVSVATVYRYENGAIEKIPGSVLEPLSKLLRTTPACLMGWEETNGSQQEQHRLSAPTAPSDTVTFCIQTHVAAHYNAISYNESITGDHIELPTYYLKGRAPEDFCAMRVMGDSMYPDYHDGDVVLVLKQSVLNHSGEVAVVCYGDEEMTIKRINYAKGEDWMELIPLNHNYPNKTIAGVDLESCRVIGIPKLLLREF